MSAEKTNIMLTSSYRHLYRTPGEAGENTFHPPQRPSNLSTEGKPWDLRALGFIQDVVHQATDPTMVIPMVLASPVYHLGKVAAMRGLLAQQGATWLSRGLSLKALPVAAAFAMETSAFSLGSRSLSHFIDGPVPWDIPSVATDWAMAGLTLGFLKSAGFAGRKTTQWLRGLDEFQPQVWTKADHRALFWSSQASAYLGLVGSHGLQASIFPEMQASGGNIWVDSLGTHLALGLGGHAGRAALGSRFKIAEQQLAAQAHRLYQATKPQFNVFGMPSGMVPAAAAQAGAYELSQPVHPGKTDPGKAQTVWAISDSQALTGGPRTGISEPSSSPEWEVAKPMSWVGKFQKSGESFLTEGKLEQDLVRVYGEVTGTEVVTHAGFAPPNLPFLGAFPAIFDVFISHMLTGKDNSVIHVRENSTFIRPIRSTAELKIKVSTKISGTAGKKQIAKVHVELFDPKAPEGEDRIAEGNTTLLILPAGPNPSGPFTSRQTLPPDPLEKFPKVPAMTHKISTEDITQYATVSGDYNPIHMDDLLAQARGLQGRIAHGMLIQGLAVRALFVADPQRDPSQPPRMTTDFKEMVRPGDTLRFFVEPFENKEVNDKGRIKVTRAGNRVTVFNQINQLVLQMLDETPGEQVRRVQDKDGIKYLYRKIEYRDGEQRVTYREIPINAQAGIERVKKIVERMGPEIEKLRALDSHSSQPMVALGVSSGNGLHFAAAQMASGHLRRGVGVFFEPLNMVASSHPVPITALENVEGLRDLAQRHLVDFPIFYANAVLPQKDGTIRKLSPAVHDAIQTQQAQSSVSDINVLNSVAFSLHISPLPGVKSTPFVPNLNFLKEGLLEMVKLKGPNDEAGQGTLIPMGYNVAAVLEELSPYFGPETLTLMATWAGGSQNIEVMPGIYGGGYLGRAKQIGEEAVLDFHLRSREQGYALGHHKVVRLPSFNSRALWMIPGGSLMGLTAKLVLDKASPHGQALYQDLTHLAPRTLHKILDNSHVRENPLAQIELDAAENAYIGEIKKHLDLVYQRVADELPGYREAYLENTGHTWDGKTFDMGLLQQIPDFALRFQERHGREYQPFTYPDGSIRIFDMAATRRILEGIVPENWQELMPAPDAS